MSKTLVITEKPSVAADLNKALGGKGAKAEFFEVGDYIITSAVGHLAELCLPNSMTKGKGISWKLASLPIIPDHFELKPIPRSAERLSLVKKLLKRPDVTAVINACDAGREGELIFHNIMQISGVKKPVQRLWLQSMTQDSIRAGFAALRPAKEMEDLAAAAICRAESDWLVGINSTRALTAVNSGDRGFQLTPVGRVQTPTLAILSEREERIRNFVPKTYYEVHATFGVQAGEYGGRWFDPNFKKGKNLSSKSTDAANNSVVPVLAPSSISDTLSRCAPSTPCSSSASATLKTGSENVDDEAAKAERLWDQELALAIVERCQGQIGIIEEQKKATTQAAPLLYDLTSLQREANSRFGFSAKRTLQLAQRLYEHHKVLTYPRTDSRYLPEDNVGAVRKALEQLEGGLEKHVALLFEKGWFVKTGKVFNNAKVSDHHAIIPTGASIEKLDEAERKLYHMVAQRLVAIFYPVARFDVTTRITRVGEEHFKSEGKILTDPGWLAVYGKNLESEEGGDKTLVPVAAVGGKNEEAQTIAVEAQEAQTRPPARFTEATLLSAMEGAGKLVEDEELREAMSQRGLGTPATRAAIIEGLLLDGYVARQGRELAATSKGMALINLLHHIGIAALTSPEMTGEWEFKLKGIEQHQVQREKFMEEICRFTREIVEKAKGFQDDEGNFPDLEVLCPKCGKGPFAENVRQFKCRECGWSLWKSLASRPLEREEIRELLEKKKVGPLEGFRSRFGKSFTAMLLLDEELKPKFSFSEEGNEEAEAQLQQAEVIASCPLCKVGTIRDGMNAFVCDQTISKKCSFRMGKTILQQPITREQVIKLTGEGKTDLLTGFVSKKGRKFSAFLKLEGGKVSFEFTPRATGKKAGNSKTKKILKQVTKKEKKEGA